MFRSPEYKMVRVLIGMAAPSLYVEGGNDNIGGLGTSEAAKRD